MEASLSLKKWVSRFMAGNVKWVLREQPRVTLNIKAFACLCFLSNHIILGSLETFHHLIKDI